MPHPPLPPLRGEGSSGKRPLPDGRHQVPGGWNRIHLTVTNLEEEVVRLRAAGVPFRTNEIVSGPGGTQVIRVLEGMMVSKKGPQITVRDAEEADVTALTTIKGEGSEAVHRDRLRDAREASLRYLVLLADEEIIGFACLVFRRPSYWSDAKDTQHLPQIID